MRSSKSRSRNKNNRNRSSSLGNIVNRVFDSNGPEGKVRGTPQQIIDKYNQLARDAGLANDRVNMENFQQHAEHYLRMLNEAQREIEAKRNETGHMPKATKSAIVTETYDNEGDTGFLGDTEDFVLEIRLAHVKETLAGHRRVVDGLFVRHQFQDRLHERRLAGRARALDDHRQRPLVFQRHLQGFARGIHRA